MDNSAGASNKLKSTKIIGCALSLLLILAGSSWARVWYVKPDSTGDAPTIQAGIDSCANGDTVLVARGGYLCYGAMDFNGKAIVVRSLPGDANIYLDSPGPAFRFRSGEDSTSILEGFVFSGLAGHIECDHSSPLIQHCLMYLTYGEIECSVSSAIIRRNVFRSPWPAAIVCRNSRARIIENRFEGADVYWGIIKCEDDSSVIMDNYFSGGDHTIAIFCTRSTNRIVRNTFSWCTGVSCRGGSYEILENSMDGSNHTSGIFCDSSTAVIRGNEIVGMNNGGLYISNGTYRIEGNLIWGCSYPSCNGSGGGIDCRYVDSSTTIMGNSIVGNYTGICGRGGGIYCYEASPIISGNTIRDNNAEWSWGGAICCDHNSSPTIINNTIVDNTACGGVINCSNLSSPIIKQNIIANNFDEWEWGHCYNASSGICVADESCHPQILCCDVINNGDSNYAGIPDQTGINGNISVDPLFCDAENHDYTLHFTSRCLPGNHPDGASCKLIGALGQGCDYTATLLQSYHAEVEASAISITWELSEVGMQMECSILRAEAPGYEYGAIPDAYVRREGLSFSFRDTGARSGSVYRYRVDVSDEAGRRVLFETDAISLAPLRLALNQNYPNPFNPATRISYSLPSRQRVMVEIFDVAGRRMAVLVGEEREAGSYFTEWNGLDERGKSVASGVYFCRLTAGKETISRKMVLLR